MDRNQCGLFLSKEFLRVVFKKLLAVFECIDSTLIIDTINNVTFLLNRSIYIMFITISVLINNKKCRDGLCYTPLNNSCPLCRRGHLYDMCLSAHSSVNSSSIIYNPQTTLRTPSHQALELTLI